MQIAGRQGFFRARSSAGYWGLYAEALQAGSTVTVAGSYLNVAFESSVDGGRTWTPYTKGTAITLASIGDRAYFRATASGNTFTGDSNFSFTGRVAIGGNIMSLLSQAEITEFPATTSSSCFNGLFRDNTYGSATALVDASALSLPATTLTAGCYNAMFCYQGSLTAAPALPATTLAQECYRGMFGYCSSLTTAPALPATSLARQCYAEMFSGCTALTTAPALPAMTANYRCYQNMFAGCTSLTAAPALPATTVGSECYNYMFQNCTSLTAAPTLPATTVEASSYANMFEGCTALVTAPALPATTLANYCYQSMFMGCTSLTAAPSLPATRCYYYGCYRMFKGCTSLVTPPAIAATTLGQYCYKEMFSGCSSLATAPTLPATSLQQDCYFEMFRDCTSLTAAPALPATSMVYDCYRGMFSGCTALTSASALPATTLASDCYHMMYAYCTSLVTPPTMAATTLASACCDTMFYNCTALTRSPALMATDLSPTNCYSWMFNGCSSLAEVTTKQTSFSNCGAWLSGVAATGTFRCPEALGDDSTIQRGPSACPSGWTVDNGVYWGLTISATQVNSTVAMAANGSAPSITLEYSTDNGETWTAFVPGTTTVTLANVGDKVSIRAGANGNATLATSTANYHRFVFTGGVALSGNAYSLLTQSRTTTLPSGTTTYALAHIFRDNSAAIDASKLMLSDLTLTINSVYQYMFYNCTGLSAAPALPATTVSYAGYANMFQGCTALTTAPALPATTISGWCYGDMFHGCTALTTVPATLPATTLASDCYNGMFHSCSSLTVAPALPATTLASQCYRTMFQQTGLLESPVLPAETQATRCYYGMFWYCPNIHKITTKQTSFSGCRAWVDGVPSTGEFVCNTDALGDDSTIQRGIDACPVGWTVSAAPSGYWGFYVEAANPNAYSSVGMSRYGSPPSVTLEYSTDNGETWQAFEVGSTSIGLAPGERAYFRAGSAGNVRLASYDYSYNYFDFSQAVRIGGNILSLLSQTEITAIPTSDNFTFSNLFRGQTTLVDASALILPTNITGHGLQYTFQGCTSLTAAPHLPATTLADACYAYLFTNCSALASISTAQTDFGDSISACYDWVRGVAASGTFTCPSALGTQSTISRSSSSCPNNWTVVNT